MGGAAVASGRIHPCISLKQHEPYVVLPSFFADEDNDTGSAMIGLAERIGLTIYLVEMPDLAIKDTLSKSQEEFGKGVLLGAYDEKLTISVNHKRTDLERGRTFIRAQQAYGYFTQRNKSLGEEALKESQEFFGGHAVTSHDGKKVQTRLMADTIKVFATIISGRGVLAEDLVRTCLTLIRHSHTLIPVGEVLDHMISDCMIPMGDAIQRYGTITVVTTEKGGRRGKVESTKKRVVPRKPRPSSLLLSEENHIISEISSDLFKNPKYFENSKEWVLQIGRVGFTAVKDAIQNLTAARNAYVMKYAAMTTRRLREYKAMPNALGIKRKAQINMQDIEWFLNGRENLITSFSNEIIFMDPTFETVNNRFRCTAINEEESEVFDYGTSFAEIRNFLESRWDSMITYKRIFYARLPTGPSRKNQIDEESDTDNISEPSIDPRERARQQRKLTKSIPRPSVDVRPPGDGGQHSTEQAEPLLSKAERRDSRYEMSAPERTLPFPRRY
jgi:hypothetical protein